MKKFIFWVLAIIITLGASVYQRMTGPTNPKYETVVVDGKEYKFKLPRSGGVTDCRVVLKGLGVKGDTFGVDLAATLFWKKYPGEGEFIPVRMIPGEEGLTAFLPGQPQAGKLEYYIELLTFQRTREQSNMSRTMLC